ncbi:chromobox protein homolog 5 [Drosophila erecta]|uniref:HP1D2B n=1 Tax=Drosophila erecta TaxID=7220 RepID=B3NVF7_DROER|nr:chromobox protein homolog 5 [Drosophila erecta]AMR36258.1 HP1D2B [Drosophila erecta]EDV46349.1 uncharacterized protein Dere_GG18261 [Drosophila erecta]
MSRKFNTIPITSDDASEDDASLPNGHNGEWEVEKILAKRVQNGRAQYFVKWLGFPMVEATWEPYENMSNCCKLVGEYERKSYKRSQQNKKPEQLEKTNPDESDMKTLEKEQQDKQRHLRGGLPGHKKMRRNH